MCRDSKTGFWTKIAMCVELKVVSRMNVIKTDYRLI